MRLINSWNFRLFYFVQIVTKTVISFTIISNCIFIISLRINYLINIIIIRSVSFSLNFFIYSYKKFVVIKILKLDTYYFSCYVLTRTCTRKNFRISTFVPLLPGIRSKNQEKKSSHLKIKNIFKLQEYFLAHSVSELKESL